VQAFQPSLLERLRVAPRETTEEADADRGRPSRSGIAPFRWVVPIAAARDEQRRHLDEDHRRQAMHVPASSRARRDEGEPTPPLRPTMRSAAAPAAATSAVPLATWKARSKGATTERRLRTLRPRASDAQRMPVPDDPRGAAHGGRKPDARKPRCCLVQAPLRMNLTSAAPSAPEAFHSVRKAGGRAGSRACGTRRGRRTAARRVEAARRRRASSRGAHSTSRPVPRVRRSARPEVGLVDDPAVCPRARGRQLVRRRNPRSCTRRRGARARRRLMSNGVASGGTSSGSSTRRTRPPGR